MCQRSVLRYLRHSHAQSDTSHFLIHFSEPELAATSTEHLLSSCFSNKPKILEATEEVRTSERAVELRPVWRTSSNDSRIVEPSPATGLDLGLLPCLLSHPSADMWDSAVILGSQTNAKLAVAELGRFVYAGQFWFLLLKSASAPLFFPSSHGALSTLTQGISCPEEFDTNDVNASNRERFARGCTF
ncbi:hypothetical protein BO82DRAFT_362924 [Aspergillus uvarum CBS 121591]|uniref:Uncharacterized protein n=1 Tax=Aspergillus uvarum CBS 121591 TaxID=1448315 RepID=A0A319CHY9_9EURO|nr:hypothetical protein BO82DRAFT_362924 [Aspergillus uvarum CBS 121591]PYH84050.1 hypothetical protein BO82DRAFT_362924 [Aspergillus uvarum CBS 121591]